MNGDFLFKVIPLFCTAHNIGTSKMVAILPTSAKLNKKGPLLQS